MILKDKELLTKFFSAIPVYFNPSSEPFTNFELYLESGFEAFSGRASETWETRWVVKIRIPEVKNDSILSDKDRELYVLKQKQNESDEDFFRSCLEKMIWIRDKINKNGSKSKDQKAAS